MDIHAHNVVIVYTVVPEGYKVLKLVELFTTTAQTFFS